MADIGSLIVKIGADASGLQKAFADLGGSAKRFQQGLGAIANIAGTAFIAAASAAVAMTIAAGRQAEELDQLAAATGINTDRLQEYDVMLNRAGLSGQDLAVIMKNVAQSLDQARQGTGTAGDRFRQLGIDIATVTDSDDLLRKIAIASGNLADGFAKTAIMTDLLGKSWQQALKLFQDGEGGLRSLGAASKNLGETLSTSQVQTLKEMDDQIDDTILAYKRFGQQLGASLAPNIKFVTELIKDLMVVGANHIAEFGLAWDVLATKVLHFGLQVGELSATLFSSKIFSAEAWNQTLASMKFIGAESDKQVARLRVAFELAKVVAPLPDARKQPPALVDTAKRAQEQQALLDVQLRSQETFRQDSLAVAKAAIDREMALLDHQKAFAIRSTFDIETDRQKATARMDAFTVDSLTRQLNDYQTFIEQKRKLFTQDQKGRADLAKFEDESHSKELSMITKIALAQQTADTNRIRSGTQVVTFWQKQLQDIVASNVFSVAQIVTTWTSGIANSIVKGGNFAKAAWEATQIAIVQGVLNMGVQLAAQWALQASLEVGILTAKEATKLGLVTTTNAAILANEAGTAAGTVGIWAGATAAIAGFFATFTAALSAMFASLVGVMTAVGTFVMGVLSAIAEALADTIFGIPFAGAILLGIALIAAALALSGNLGFKEGGIGDFGSGTPAMLHGPEAVIPLNSRGASFMQEAFGGGNERVIHTHVYLKGREIAMAVSDDLPSALRTSGVPA